MKKWLTVAEAAEYSGVSRDTIYTACERSELRHIRISGRRSIRMRPVWIDEWLERHARGGHASVAMPLSANSTSAHTRQTSGNGHGTV
jgi:excisionase family DNA binding protein